MRAVVRAALRAPKRSARRLGSAVRGMSRSEYPPLAQAPTLPATWYRCPEQFERERARCFWTQWQCVATSDQLSNPRDFVTDTIAGWPIIVQRARKPAELSAESPSTTLRAFHNVCRHRAGPLALPQDTRTLDGEQRCSGQSPINGFRCRYHGWVYSEAGDLKGTPHFDDKWPDGTPASQREMAERRVPAGCSAAGCSPEALPEFDKSDLGLFPLEVREEMGLVFVRLHCDRAVDMGLNPPMDVADARRLATQFDTALGESLDALRGVGLETYQFYSMETHELKCNWKTYVDNYSEGYHIFVCHQDLNDEITHQGDYRVDVSPSGRSMRHVVPLKEGSDAASSGVWVFSYPNLAINVYGAGISVERMLPLTPTTMAIKYFYSFKPGTTDEDKQKAIAGSRQLTDEDRDIAEQVQRNLDSGVYTASRYSPRHENGTYAFHKTVWEACQ